MAKTDTDREPTAHELVLSDDDLALASAFVDGALSGDDEAAFVGRLDAEPALMDAVCALAALRGVLAPGAASIDVADAVMAAVAPEALSPTRDGALLGGMLLADGEASSAAVIDVPAHDGALLGLASAVAAVRADLRARQYPVDVAPVVAAAIDDDAQALELAMRVADGEGARADVETLATLLDAPLHGVRRVAEVSAMLAARAHVVSHFAAHAAAPAASHAGERATHAITASSSVGHGGGPTRRTPETPVPFFERMFRLVPAGIAVAAVALFMLVGRMGGEGDPSGDPLVDAIPAEPALALAPLDVLPDNTSTVEALETGSGAAVVFSTPASHITIIWVGGGAERAEQGT